jgi:hypothetical protein
MEILVFKVLQALVLVVVVLVAADHVVQPHPDIGQQAVLELFGQLMAPHMQQVAMVVITN